MKIFKYQLELIDKDKEIIQMPKDALIRYVGVQNNIICLWAEVDETQPLVNKEIFIVGTGHDIPEKAEYYIGTVQMSRFVWHIYE